MADITTPAVTDETVEFSSTMEASVLDRADIHSPPVIKTTTASQAEQTASKEIPREELSVTVDTTLVSEKSTTVPTTSFLEGLAPAEIRMEHVTLSSALGDIINDSIAIQIDSKIAVKVSSGVDTISTAKVSHSVQEFHI